MCTYCNLCVITCPSNAIVFSNDFEGAVYNREKLVHQLNKEGSKLREKKKEPVAAAPKPQPATPKEAVTPKEEAPKASNDATEKAENKTDL